MIRVQNVPVSKIKTDKMLAPTAGFVRSVERFGIQVPVVLFQHKKDGPYHIADGKRRVGAALKLGEDTVPAIVIPKGQANDMTALGNLQRSDNPGAEALCLKRKRDEGLSRREIADLYGISLTKVKQRLALTRLVPALFDRLYTGDLSARAGYKALSLSTEDQKVLARKQGPVLVRDVEDLLRQRQVEQVAGIEIPPFPGAPTVPEPPPEEVPVRAVVSAQAVLEIIEEARDTIGETLTMYDQLKICDQIRDGVLALVGEPADRREASNG